MQRHCFARLIRGVLYEELDEVLDSVDTTFGEFSEKYEVVFG